MPSHKDLLEKIIATDKTFQDKDIQSFAESFMSKLPEGDVSGMSSDEMAAVIKDHWELSKKRKLGEAKLEIKLAQVSKNNSAKGRSKTRTATVISIVCDDMAFTINSIASELMRESFKFDRFFHPRIQTKAQQAMVKKQVDARTSRRFGETHIYIQIDAILNKEEMRELEQSLRSVLEDVQLANKEWPLMLEDLKSAMNQIEKNEGYCPAQALDEYKQFLNYLYDDNFTLLGTFELDLKAKSPKPENTHGLMSPERGAPYFDFQEEGFPLWNNPGNSKQTPLIVTKLKKLSSVHRIVPLDAVSVIIYDEKGVPEKELVFIGLFTSVTYSRSIQDVPYLRQKADSVIKQSGFLPAGHDYKALRHILEKFPRDELFQIDEDSLAVMVMSIMRLQQQPRIALFTRNNPYNNLFSCMVYFPREQFDTRLRLKVQRILEEELNGKTRDFFTTMDDSLLARVMFILVTKRQIGETSDIDKIESKIREECRDWGERFKEACDQYFDDQEFCSFVSRHYEDAFPVEYQERVKPKHALYDVTKIEEAFENKGGMSFDLYRSTGQSGKQIQLKIYSVNSLIPLSDILPILENMGLKVFGERPYEVRVRADKKPVWINDFLMEALSTDQRIDLKEVKPIFEEAVTKIWFGAMENDGLNKLILTSEMNWREVTILRSYIRYLHQIRYVFSLRYMEQAATENPVISRLIVNYFKAAHDPKDSGKNQAKAEEIYKELLSAFDRVESLDHDRILRRIAETIRSTLRTNFFKRDDNGEEKSYLSLKIDSMAIKDLPSPRPYREIFVYSPRMEGIHLRGDKIARGGIRWSDRQEDFRTEVLGLMKAQLVKNSIIVPMGAKGGFIVKKNMKNARKDQIQKEGIECYKTLVSGMLDITDNIVNDKVVPPRDVVRHDGDDTYLVVAADKGTATFSDIANQISKNYNFWMDDAFASGGGTGYDHKKMGITAKGAWESVKRHFQEINHDTQSQDFQVVGVGDMGGDVFGNGMLLSKHIKLVAAFNHRHIFIDPDPDPAKSWEERQRLFDGALGWDQYDKNLLSKGGGVFERMEKSLSISEEAQKWLGVNEQEITPEDLIKAILRSSADLIWFGGIGTYVKASNQTNIDVGDKSNDNLRINACELRARVIGEGANLAITQEARVEASQKGVRLNADFIDNSGGVDCSDHEVNIKILLSDVIKRKKLSVKARNELLESMTDDVAELVLRNNYQQALAVSLMEFQSYENINQQREFITDLETAGLLDRKETSLPSDKALSLRHSQGKGLSRPELALLQAYAKILFTQDLLQSDIPDSENMQNFLTRYFPDALEDLYLKEILNHSLRREIIATEIANGMINRMGPTFVKSRMMKTGASSDMVAKAYIIVRESFDLRHLWDIIEDLDLQVPAMIQLKAMRDIAELVERETTWFLTRLGREPDIDKDIPVIQEGVRKLKTELFDVVTETMKNNITQTEQGGIQDGLPKDIAKEIALIPVLSSACDIIRIGNSLSENILTAAALYFEVGEYFHLEWLRKQARYMVAEDKWSAEAKEGIIDQLYTCQAGITTKIIMDLKPEIPSEKQTRTQTQKLFETWIDKNKQTGQVLNLINDMRRASGVDISMLIIAEQRLRGIFGG